MDEFKKKYEGKMEAGQSSEDVVRITGTPNTFHLYLEKLRGALSFLLHPREKEI